MKQQETERTIQAHGCWDCLVAKYGYSKTSIDQMVKEAGISNWAFYAHFPTKEDFLMKILQDGISFYFEDLREVVTNSIAESFGGQ